MNHKMKLLVFGIILVLFVGCGSSAPSEQVELSVSAAASLTDCMNELFALYKTKVPIFFQRAAGKICWKIKWY